MFCSTETCSNACDNYVMKVDALIEYNAEAHKTLNYDRTRRNDCEKRLVIRRGQDFLIRVYFNQDYNKCDKISIAFTLDGQTPDHKNHTYVVVPICENEEQSKNWHATMVAEEQSSIVIKINSSTNAMIGKWNMKIDIVNKKNCSSHEYQVPDPIYMIFNPWCNGDGVFIPSEDQRKEYVLSDTGCIWQSNVDKPAIWEFAQFKENILDCALYILTDIAKVGIAQLNDPIKMTRKLSKALNACNGNNGVLVEKWDGEFDDGVSPSMWTGSEEILQQYFCTKQSVAYGRCWVYAGVFATVCRALGLPCRVVTNYQSAYDADGSLTIDYFVDDDAKTVEELSTDSIWSFHVWNEVWMKRPDIGDGLYDGWQVVDVTRQEPSDGTFGRGPMSVVAIRRGDLTLPYDGKFIYAEVNADEVFWKYDGPGIPLKFIKKNTNRVGVNISTKAVGRWTREDITHTYKDCEGTEMERETFINLLRTNNNWYSRCYIDEGFTDIYFDYTADDNKNTLCDMPNGGTLKIENKNLEKEYTVSIICRTELTNYTERKLCDSQKILEAEYTIQPRATKLVYIDLQSSTKFEKLSDDCTVIFKCLAKVRGTNYEFLVRKKWNVHVDQDTDNTNTNTNTNTNKNPNTDPSITNTNISTNNITNNTITNTNVTNNNTTNNNLTNNTTTNNNITNNTTTNTNTTDNNITNNMKANIPSNTSSNNTNNSTTNTTTETNNINNRTNMNTNNKEENEHCGTVGKEELEKIIMKEVNRRIKQEEDQRKIKEEENRKKEEEERRIKEEENRKKEEEERRIREEEERKIKEEERRKREEEERHKREEEQRRITEEGRRKREEQERLLKIREEEERRKRAEEEERCRIAQMEKRRLDEEMAKVLNNLSNTLNNYVKNRDSDSDDDCPLLDMFWC